MTKINVVIASSPHDVLADGIGAVIEANDEWIVVGKRVISLGDIDDTRTNSGVTADAD